MTFDEYCEVMKWLMIECEIWFYEWHAKLNGDENGVGDVQLDDDDEDGDRGS